MSEAFDEFSEAADTCVFGNENNIPWPNNDDLLSVAIDAVDAASNTNNMNFPSSVVVLGGQQSYNTLDNWANVKAHIGAKKKTIGNAFVINCLNNVDNCCPFNAPSGNFQGDICGTLTYNNPKNVALSANGGVSSQSLGTGGSFHHAFFFASANIAINGTTTCESTNDYESFHDRACEGRNELGSWEYNWATRQWCEDRCSADSRCTSFEWRPEKNQRNAKCQVSSSCFNGLGYDTGSNGDWTLYQKKTCFSMTGSGGDQWWRLRMPNNRNHKIRKVVVWVPQDEASDQIRDFTVRGWRSAPLSLDSVSGGWNNWDYSHDGSKSALDSDNGWKAEILVNEDVDVNRIEIMKDDTDGKPVRLAEVQVYTKEVLTSSTLPSKEDYQAAILTAMRNKANEVTSDVEACYIEQCG